ncbi:Alpha-oxoamine synthase/8-amino-7-oxononanoate synthase [Planctomycetales bacterium 10988]|nr:Alpha-oxoamine synthase/8-amino-7-oxononanoate synthase [Planctomycetales bacterium 10988]
MSPKTKSDPFGWMQTELDERKETHLFRQRKVRSGPQTTTISLDDQALINFASNDYLGLAHHPQVLEAARLALETESWGSGASPLVTGYQQEVAALEQDLAEWEHTEAALVFPSGFAANLGIIPALVRAGDLVLGDHLNHASLIDGCRLSGARFRTYRHADLSRLEHLLKRESGFRRRLIVTDSLFSMDGDCAPLQEMADLAERYDAMLLVDEAHATGVFGEHGSGLADQPDLRGHIPFRVGTLSKGLGCVGGFVVGPQTCIDWLVNNARPYIYSTAFPAANAAAARAAVKIARLEISRRERLLNLAESVRNRLTEQGWEIGPSTTQIIPIMVGDAERAVSLSESLQEAGFWVPAIRPPTVPPNTARLRLSLTSEHTKEMIDGLLDALGTPPA